MNSEYRVISAKTMFEFRSLVIECNGWVFDIVYGHTEKGYFISVPNHNISCVTSEPEDTLYNMGKILRECNNETMAMVITKAIKEDYEEWKKDC